MKVMERQTIGNGEVTRLRGLADYIEEALRRHLSGETVLDAAAQRAKQQEKRNEDVRAARARARDYYATHGRHRQREIVLKAAAYDQLLAELTEEAS